MPAIDLRLQMIARLANLPSLVATTTYSEISGAVQLERALPQRGVVRQGSRAAA